MSIPRVVLDTNILVAAGFSPGSASAHLVDAVRAGRLRMAWNDATREEIEHILGKIPPLRRRDWSSLFRADDRVTAPTFPARFAIVPDPDDRVFAALAAAADAVLVSNDAHLLDCADRLDVPVMSSGTLWRTLRGEDAAHAGDGTSPASP